MSFGIEEKYIIPGERFVSSINTTLKHLTSRIEGVLCLTNFKVKIIPKKCWTKKYDLYKEERNVFLKYILCSSV